MPMPWMPLLAAGLDWLEGLLPLLFVLVWIGSQVWGVFRKIGGNDKAKPPRAGPAVRRGPRPVPAAPWLEEDPGAADPGLRRDLEQQIEEFLRESGAEVKRKVARREESPPPRSPRPARKPALPPRPRAMGSSQMPPAVRSLARPGSQRREHVIGSLAERTSDIARHVEDAFADDLVHRQAKVAVEPSVAVAPVALDVVAMVRDPATLRQLVLVREVLERPTDRW